MREKRVKKQDHTSPKGYEVAGSERVKVVKEQLARALADYDNFRKRTEEREVQQRFAIKAQVIGRLLPVFDMLYGAQMHLKDSGLALTIRELEETLKNEGIEAIVPRPGDKFTEDLHEAIEVVKKEGLSEGQIAECALRGWKFVDGNVLRHAKVKVNSSK